MASKLALAQLAPRGLAIDLRAGVDADDARQASLAAQGKPGAIGTAPSCRNDDAVLANGLHHAAHGPSAHRHLRALHAPFAHGGIRGTPVNRGSATAHKKGDHAPMWFVFHWPINGQTSLAGCGSLRQRL